MCDRHRGDVVAQHNIIAAQEIAWIDRPRLQGHLASLAQDADAEVSSLVARFRDKWKFERVAAGHCTGEFAFSEFNRVYGAKYDRAVVGAVIALPR